jgi:predicted nucleic acid-binding protein
VTSGGAIPLPSHGLLDTSIFIAREADRPLGELPEIAAVSVVTVAELEIGVLMARSQEIRGRRLHTLTAILNDFEPLPIDLQVARIFAELAAAARQQGTGPGIMDMWIAATAMANELPVYTQDLNFSAIPRVRVYQV